jgi:hypothetical protein
MKNKPAHHRGWLILLPIIIVVALVVNGLDPGAQYATLYFPSIDRTSLRGEKRRLDLMGNVEKRAQIVVSELLLGPVSRKSLPLFSGDSQLSGVMKRGDTLFVNIHLADPTSMNASWKIIYTSFERSLSESVPGAGKTRLFLDGNELVIH